MQILANALLLTLIIIVQLETVPYLIDNPEVGYVQARWIFANPDECYLTKVSLLHAFISANLLLLR